jgi:hypothetical protein
VDEREREIEENAARIKDLARHWEIPEGSSPMPRVAAVLEGLSAGVRGSAQRFDLDPVALRWMGLYLEFWAGQMERWACAQEVSIAEWANDLDPDAASTSDG